MEFTKQEIDAVYPKVAEVIADALGVDVGEVKPDSSLIEDLDAESIDFLDLVFRLERAFKVKIPRSKIVEDARGSLTESEFEQKGVITEAGLVQLKAFLSEVPAGPLQDTAQGRGDPAPVHARDFLQDGAARAEGCSRSHLNASSMSGRYSAFTFCDRITEFEPARHASGQFLVPDHLTGFSSSLCAEATGQLAAWVSMANIGFRGRPVAALAKEVRILGDLVPGDTLHLEVEIEECDEDAVAYRGHAHVNGHTDRGVDRLPGTDAAAAGLRRS